MSAPRADRFRVDQIDHVEVFVPDRRRAAEWYRKVLGLRAVPEYEQWAEDPHGPLMISSDGGSTKLALFEGAPQGRRSTTGFHRVAFRVNGTNFVRFLGRLPGLELRDPDGNLVTESAAVDHATAFSVYFCDPYGHRLELTTYEHDEVRTILSTPAAGNPGVTAVPSEDRPDN